MKKGLAILKLAIALVVVGLILSVAIKGKSLLDTAKIRAEIAGFKKFEYAVMVYNIKQEKLPLDERNTYIHIDTRALLSYNLLTENDVHSFSTGARWDLLRCSLSDDNKYLIPSANSENICLNNPVPMPAKTMCYIEVLVDDKDLEGGYGRTSKTFAAIDYSDCENQRGSSTYLYRIY